MDQIMKIQELLFFVTKSWLLNHHYLIIIRILDNLQVLELLFNVYLIQQLLIQNLLIIQIQIMMVELFIIVKTY